MENEAQQQESPLYVPVTHWPAKYPSQSAWRALIHAASPRHSSKGKIPGNGLIEAGVIRRVGRRVLVSPSKFYAWIEKRGGQE